MPIRPENVDRYPVDWKQISEAIRFGRAKGRCECVGECGLPHAGRCRARHGLLHPVTKSWVVLTTAHLDHTPENCDEANLRAMCQSCHVNYDKHLHAATARRTRAATLAAQMEPLFSIAELAPATGLAEPT